jgi:AraC-like DNA-binding protein
MSIASPLLAKRQILKPDSFGWNEHTYFEIAICLSGEAFHKTLSDKVKIRKSCVVLMNTFEPHTWQVQKEIELIFIQCNRSYISQIKNKLGELPALEPLEHFQDQKNTGHQCLTIELSEWPFFKLLVEKLIVADQHLTSHSSTYVQTLFFQILHLLTHNSHSEDPTSKNRLPHDHQKINEALTWLQVHYAQKMSVSEIAERLSLSSDYFTKLFKAQTHYHFSEYQQELRIRAACEALRTTDISIGELAEKIGYSHTSHLIKQFKKITGMSPLAWRKRS